MSNAQINDWQLDAYCESIAEEIFRDAKDHETALDWAHERADGSQYVIYTYKAHALCQNCSTDAGHEFLADCFGQEAPADYDQLASIIAYGEIASRIEDEIDKLFAEAEAKAEAA